MASLEVRWIHAGRLPEPLAQRLAPFPDVEVREDWYLTDPVIPGLSVKVRGGAELDVKVLSHGGGRLSLPGGARGRLELWHKWSFPAAGVAECPFEPACWTRVIKTRRRRSFAVVNGIPVERPASEAASPGCTIELTEFRIDGRVSWTLGIEAVGPLVALRGNLEATARTLIDGPLTTRFGLHSRASASYHQRLRAGARMRANAPPAAPGSRRASNAL